MALEVARKYLEATLQKELCKRFSSRFDNVNTPELSPFIAVLRMIKVEYAQTKPEVFRTLVAILHDFDCTAGEEHREKTAKYVRILLSQQPELADFLVSVLPPGPGSLVRDPPHVLHTLQSQCYEKADYKGRSAADRSLLQMDAKKLKKDQVQFFNFTPPAVNAYVASKGVPQKIITSSSLASLSTSTVDVSTKFKADTIVQKSNGKTGFDEASVYQIPAAVHRYVIVNEPGPHIKKADSGKGSNTTVIQIPHGTSAFGLNRLAEKREAQGSPMSETEGYSEGSDTSSSTSFRITRVNPKLTAEKDCRSSDSDSSSQLIRHFICDKNGRLRMQPKPTTSVLRSKDADKSDTSSPVVLRKRKAPLGLDAKKCPDKRVKLKEFVFEEHSKVKIEKQGLSMSYAPSNNPRTFPYKQTVMLSNDNATKGSADTSMTKTGGAEGKMSPLVQLENMVHKSSIWEEIVGRDTDVKKSSHPIMAVPAYPYSIPAGGPLFNTTAASKLVKDINNAEVIPVDLCTKFDVEVIEPGKEGEQVDQELSSGSTVQQVDPSVVKPADTPLDLSFQGGSEQAGFSTSSSEEGEMVICDENEGKLAEERQSPEADAAEVMRHSQITSRLRVVLCSKLKATDEGL